MSCHPDWASRRQTLTGLLFALTWRIVLRCITHRDIDPTKRQWLTQRGTRPEADRILTCSNCLLDIDTRATYSHTPEFFTTIALNIAYDAKAPEPINYHGLLDNQWDDDWRAKALMQEWNGYLLSGDTHLDKMLWIIGPTRSGKGTYARILELLLGEENVVYAGLSTFSGQFRLQNWVGKSLALFSDAKKGMGNATEVETMLAIVGRDKVEVDRKHKQPLQCRLGVRLMVMSNEVPKFYEPSGALAGRILMLRTKKSYLGKENRKLEKLLEGEMSAILNDALDGYDRLTKNERFTEPEAPEEKCQQLDELFSPVKRFMADEGLAGHRDLELSADVVFDLWKAWCAGEGYTSIPTKTSLFTQLEATIPFFRESQRRIKGSRKRPRIWVGIGYAKDAPDDGEGEHGKGDACPDGQQRQPEVGTAGTGSAPLYSLTHSHSHRNNGWHTVPAVPDAFLQPMPREHTRCRRRPLPQERHRIRRKSALMAQNRGCRAVHRSRVTMPTQKRCQRPRLGVKVLRWATRAQMPRIPMQMVR